MRIVIIPTTYLYQLAKRQIESRARTGLVDWCRERCFLRRRRRRRLMEEQMLELGQQRQQDGGERGDMRRDALAPLEQRGVALEQQRAQTRRHGARDRRVRHRSHTLHERAAHERQLAQLRHDAEHERRLAHATGAAKHHDERRRAAVRRIAGERQNRLGVAHDHLVLLLLLSVADAESWLNERYGRRRRRRRKLGRRSLDAATLVRMLAQYRERRRRRRRRRLSLLRAHEAPQRRHDLLDLALAPVQMIGLVRQHAAAIVAAELVDRKLARQCRRSERFDARRLRRHRR